MHSYLMHSYAVHQVAVHKAYTICSANCNAKYNHVMQTTNWEKLVQKQSFCKMHSFYQLRWLRYNLQSKLYKLLDALQFAEQIV